MGTQITNKLVTRGFGAKRSIPNSAGPVMAGFGGPPHFVVAALEENRPARLRLGQSGAKRRLDQLDEVIIWAKLIEVNNQVPKRPIQGAIRVQVDKKQGTARVMAEHISSRAREAWEFIKVSVRRLK